MELSKKTVSGEQLQLLKSISPKIASLAGSATSFELKSEQLFKDTKKGKTAKQKFYIFIGILLFDRQPIIMKQAFSWKVRTNITTKDELESILTEAGVKDTKAIFERAKKHYIDAEKEKTAPPPPPVQKGKPEHASYSTRLPRGMRARTSKMRANSNYSSNEEGYPNWNREPTEEERRHTAKVMEELRKAQAERNRWRADFIRESAEAWAKKFPGKQYPPEDPGWQWDHSAKEWIYFPSAAPQHNPFYNDETWARGFSGYRTGEAPPPPRAEPRSQPAAPAKPKFSCDDLLKQKGILVDGDTPRETKKKFLRWALKEHPDKYRRQHPEMPEEQLEKELVILANKFGEVSDCMDKLLMKGGRRVTRKRKH